MKRFNILIFAFVCIILFLFYRNMNLSLKPQILPRKVVKTPLKGTWVVSKYIFVGNSSLTEDNAKEFLGKKASFNDKEVYFNNEVCKNPNFKIKVVDTKDYFWSNFKIKPSVLGINSGKTKIVTVYSDNSFLNDYIEINDEYILKEYDGLLLFLRKGGAEGKGIYGFDEKNSKLVISNAQRDIVSKSGLLLGLKHKVNTGYEYRTLWVSCSYGDFSEIKEIKDILVPRKNGFWKLGVDKVCENGSIIDALWGIMLNGNVEEKIKNNKRNLTASNNIVFIGNEYVALDNEDTYKKNHYEVMLMDSLYGNKVEFSKAFGKSAGEFFKRSSESYLKRIGYKDKNSTEEELQTNWSVVRRSGRWILRGRVEEGEFDIAYATPKILTTYDDLYLPFDAIKEKIPEAIDAYTSPNKDFIVVLTKNTLMVCSMENKSIGEIKIKLELNEAESVVMSQWSTGTYVDDWGKMFKK